MLECSLYKKNVSIKNYFEVSVRDFKKKKTKQKQKWVHTMSATDTDINLFFCCKASQNSRQCDRQVNILPLQATF